MSYHYIGEEDTWPKGGIYPVSVARLKNQLEMLGQRFEFIGPNELKEGLRGERALPHRACLITFDDGLAQQYELALPLLNSMKIPAGFFICGLPLAEKKAIDVHKLHWCLAHLSIGGVIGVFNQYCQKNFGRQLEALFQPLPKGGHRLGSDQAKALKYNFYNVFNQNLRDKLLRATFEYLEQDEAGFAAGFYMGHEAIKELSERGYLGLHTYRHAPLATMSYRGIINDLNGNQLALEKAVGHPLGPMGLSYPYGRPAFLSETGVQAVSDFGISFALTTLRGFNHIGTDPLWLRRMDTNDVPGGKRPTFDVDDLARGPYEYCP